MNLFRKLFLVILLCIGLFSQGQVDSNFIQRFPDKLVLSPYISTSGSNIEFVSRPRFLSDTIQRIGYSPNLKSGYGISFSYHIIDFSLGLRFKLDDYSEKKYGKSSSIGLSFRLWLTRNFLGEFNTSLVQGYSNRSTASYDSTKVNVEFPYEHRPDMYTFYLKLRGVYQFNPDRFSYRASFAFSERQKKSAAGFLLNSHIYMLGIGGDSAFIPPMVSDYYGKYQDINLMTVGGIGLAPGVGGTWTKGRWFLTGVLFLGADYQHLAYETFPNNDNLKNENVFALMADFRMSFGYNSPRFFAGIQSWTDYNLLRPSAFKINSSFQRALISVGYRFDSPKILDKSYNAAVNFIIPKRYRKFMY